MKPAERIKGVIKLVLSYLDTVYTKWTECIAATKAVHSLSSDSSIHVIRIFDFGYDPDPKVL